MYQGAAGLLRDIEQDVYSEDVPEGLESPMKHHAFSPRAAAAAAGMVVLLVGGTATGAMAAVTSASAPSARQGTPTAPGAPTGLTAAPGNGTATLSWSPPGSDGGSPVDFYVIEGGTSPSDDSILDKTGDHTATISGLINGTAYYFSVHAQNAFGDGASATVTVTPQGSGSVTGSGSRPGSPTGLTTSYGDGFIALSWSPPASAGGSPVSGYHVYLGHSSSFAGAREFTTSGPSFRLTDAENGSLYYIKVTALNAAGESPLMMAALKGDLVDAKLLLDRGAKVDQPGWSALHYAATGPEPKIVQLLIDRGATIDSLSPNGTTPLMMAAQYGTEDSVNLLLARGADPRRRNQLNLGPVDFAKLSGREPLVKRLESAAR